MKKERIDRFVNVSIPMVIDFVNFNSWILAAIFRFANPGRLLRGLGQDDLID